MGRLQHRRISRAVDAWVDAELDRTHALMVAAHVRDCWNCSSTAETTKLIKRSLRDLGDRQSTFLSAARLRRFAEHLATTST